jgi:hypothetical protein
MGTVVYHPSVGIRSAAVLAIFKSDDVPAALSTVRESLSELSGALPILFYGLSSNISTNRKNAVRSRPPVSPVETGSVAQGKPAGAFV